MSNKNVYNFGPASHLINNSQTSTCARNLFPQDTGFTLYFVSKKKRYLYSVTRNACKIILPHLLTHYNFGVLTFSLDC